MPAKGYRRTITVEEGEAPPRRLNVWMREPDIEFLREHYGNVAKGVRELVRLAREAGRKPRVR